MRLQIWLLRSTQCLMTIHKWSGIFYWPPFYVWASQVDWQKGPMSQCVVASIRLLFICGEMGLFRFQFSAKWKPIYWSNFKCNLWWPNLYLASSTIWKRECNKFLPSPQSMFGWFHPYAFKMQLQLKRENCNWI